MTGNPYIGFGLGGCVGAMTSDSYNGKRGGDLLKSCAGGAAFGSIGGGGAGSILSRVGKGL
ncbi:hypothetical protein [Streptomyces sp. NPDC057582]|uniref:hypothetical protein n=1 Tax=Streptomyces sp. NPDC057582 TaxID=3346174 RepID=UPI0036C1A368